MKDGEIDGSVGVVITAMGFMAPDWRGIPVMLFGILFIVVGLVKYFKQASRTS